MNNMKAVLIYCYVMFIIGIWQTDAILKADIIKGSMAYGRVSLICSYWYERYEPKELIRAWKNKEKLPIVCPLIDRAASPIYWRKYAR